MRDVLDKMALEMSVHGLRYVAPSQGLALPCRLAWGAAVAAGAALATLLALSAWQDYVTSPTATVVKSTHWPLHAVPFPAVTVCPTTRVLAAPAHRLLGAVATPAELRHVLSALSLLQRPHYGRAATHLRAAGAVLGRLSAVNVTALMLQTLPPCAALFLGCYWRGAQIDCCSEFRLQRSEAGFCYSFNSLTADATLHCASDPRGPECVVRHNTAAGAASGLELFMAKDPGRDRERQREIAQGDVDGFRVSIHPPSEFPDPSLLVASWEAGSRPRVTAVHVQVSVTESAPQVRRLPPASRQCFFPDERRVRLTPVYSQRSCLAECRLRIVTAACGCRPYFYRPSAGSADECRLEQLRCVAQHAPQWSSCDECLASCHETLYSTDVLHVDDSNPTTSNASAYVDVFFSQLGVVKYERDLTFDSLQLLVSMGGIASLCLGVSLLSLVELLYWLLRLLYTQLHVKSHSSLQPQTRNETGPIKLDAEMTK